MLVLSVKEGQRIVAGKDIVITLVEAGQRRARLGFEAPDEIRVLRWKHVPTDLKRELMDRGLVASLQE